MLPDQTIAQMQQNPGQTPPYLILAEMQRRETMRKAYQASNAQNPMGQPSVNQQIAQRFQQSAPIPPQGQQGYAGGGLATLDDPEEYGFEMPDISTPIGGGIGSIYGPPKPSTTLADNLFEVQRLYGESPYKSEIGKLSEREQEYLKKKTRLGDVLMNLGLSMAASRRPDFLGALAEGGIGALTGYTRDKERNQALAREAGKERLGLMGLDERRAQALGNVAADSHRADVARYNTEYAAYKNADLMGKRQQFESQLAAMKEAGLNERNQADIEARADLEQYKRAVEGGEKRQAHQWKIDEIKEQNKGRKEVAELRRKIGSGKATNSDFQRGKSIFLSTLKDARDSVMQSNPGIDAFKAGQEAVKLIVEEGYFTPEEIQMFSRIPVGNKKEDSAEKPKQGGGIGSAIWNLVTGGKKQAATTGQGGKPGVEVVPFRGEGAIPSMPPQPKPQGQPSWFYNTVDDLNFEADRLRRRFNSYGEK